MFISIEGGEGSGKTTQLKTITDWLTSHNMPYIATREPGGTPLAEALRSLVVKGDDADCLPLSEMLIFLAARHEHVERVIKPALTDGIIVVCDRFHDSSRVYQGLARELGIEFYNRLHRQVLGAFEPDLTIYLDIDPHAGLQRAAGRGDNDTRFEGLDIAFHERLREGFLLLAQRYPHRIATINAHRPVADVAEDIQQLLTRRMA